MTQEDVHFIDKSAESEVGSPVGSAVSVPTLSEPGLPRVQWLDAALGAVFLLVIPFVKPRADGPQ